MIFYHNIDEEFKLHKVVVTKVSEAVGKLQDFGKEYGLKPILFYNSTSFPPLYYNFIDEDKELTPCFGYIIPDDTSLVTGNKTTQINAENYKQKLPSVKVEEKSENFELYLKSGEDIKKFEGFQSRFDVVTKVMSLFKKKIEEGRVLQYFYHSYHTPPSAFLLLTEEGKPTGSFALIHRVKDKNFVDYENAMTTLRPDLVKFLTNGELL